MNILDIIIGIPLLWAAYKGFTKGFIVEVATLLALIIGIYGAINFSEFTAEFLQTRLDFESEYMSYISFIVTFLGIVILINFAAHLLDKVAEAVALGIINRLFGVVFSLLKYMLIVSMLVNLVGQIDSKFDFIEEKTQDESFLYRPMLKVSHFVFNFFDFDFKGAHEEIKGKIETTITDTVDI